MLNTKKLLTKLTERYVTDTFKNAAVNITSGTAGTYATYQTIDVSKPGYKPIGVINAYFSHGSSYQILAELHVNDPTVYINYYRVTTSAYSVPAGDITIKVLYEKA